MAYKQYGVDFYDKDKNTVKEMVFDSEAARDAFYFNLEKNMNDDTIWPETAVGATAWSREIRIPGIDYGRGHIKARFPGQRVPKGAYQWR